LKLWFIFNANDIVESSDCGDYDHKEVKKFVLFCKLLIDLSMMYIGVARGNGVLLKGDAAVYKSDFFAIFFGIKNMFPEGYPMSDWVIWSYYCQYVSLKVVSGKDVLLLKHSKGMHEISDISLTEIAISKETLDFFRKSGVCLNGVYVESIPYGITKQHAKPFGRPNQGKQGYYSKPKSYNR
jgi:hypothetical protein